MSRCDDRADGDLADGDRRQPRPVRQLALPRPGDDRALPDARRSTASRSIKAASEPDAAEVERRKARWFVPYHEALSAELDRLRGVHEQVVLYDCHSIRSAVPRLFEGILPHFNIGTNGGASCAAELTKAVEAACDATSFTRVTNGRFRGGYITRHHGNAASGRARDPDGAGLPELSA